MNTAKSRVLQTSVDKTNLSFASMTGKKRKSCPQRKSSAKYSSEGEETANTFQKSLFSRLLESARKLWCGRVRPNFGHVEKIGDWDSVSFKFFIEAASCATSDSYWTRMGFERKNPDGILKKRIQTDFQRKNPDGFFWINFITWQLNPFFHSFTM